jgi:hypothetical protein
MTELTLAEKLQIEMCASGCCGGNSDEWPLLTSAIEKITGAKIGRKPGSWTQGFCVCWCALNGGVDETPKQ